MLATLHSRHPQVGAHRQDTPDSTTRNGQKAEPPALALQAAGDELATFRCCPLGSALTRGVATLCAILSLLGCETGQEGESERRDDPAETKVMPDFSLSKDTPNALYTWVDAEGEFHLTEKAEEVPPDRREVVRVVVEGKAPGTADEVFVADLSQIDGAFSVRRMKRAEWEKLGAKAREARIAELRPQEEPAGPSPADLGVDAIVYGAEWCKPCHLAEDYLKKKGARVVKKDIEEDPLAASEMRKKLKAAGMSGSSIPILDVGGTILKGFSTQSIDRALGLAQK